MREIGVTQLYFDSLVDVLKLDDEIGDDAKVRFISPQEARQISEAAFSRLRETIPSREDLKEGWYGEYMELIEMGWPWRVACYIAWASSPSIGRWPSTLQDLATQCLGLASPRVIYNWRRNQTMVSIISLMQRAPLLKARRDTFDALIKSGTNPDYKNFPDRRLILEMLGDFVQKTKLDIGKSAEEDVKNWTEERLDEVLYGGSARADRAIQVSSSKENGEGVGETPSPEEEGTAWVERGEDDV